MQLGSAADLRRRFCTARPCLDLVHTGGEGALARFEIVHAPDDLGRLLGVILGLPPLPATDADLAAMRPLRAALTRIAYDLAEGAAPLPIDAPRTDDVAVVNAAAAVPPLAPSLRPDGGITFAAPTAAAGERATEQVDRVAGDGGERGRIRVCAAENCGLLLVDTSRPGRRRWCSMELCGNRTKIRAHRSRA